MSRKQALLALHEVIVERRPFSHLQTELTPFAKTLTYGVLRYYLRLNAIANYLVPRPIKKKDAQLILLMGLFELECLEKPAYAVVNESVSLLNDSKLSFAKGLINAVLRRYTREKESIDSHLKDNLEYLYNTPCWLLQRIQKTYPNHWQHIVSENDMHPPMSLRVNTLKVSRETYKDKVDAENIPHTDTGLVLKIPMNISELPGFDKGDVSVQDGAAQLAATLLQLKPGMRLLDACAAPGGKTCHILEREPKLAQCIALDIDGRRVQKIKDNLQRLQLDKLNIQVKVGDALTPNTWWDGELFDRILLDAPCSALGIIRRHPDIKYLRTPKDISEITKVQSQLLRVLWSLLKPGGRLIYSTCSIIPEENELQIRDFVISEPTCNIIPTPKDIGIATPHGMQILPGMHTMDGFFYSVLEKANS